MSIYSLPPVARQVHERTSHWIPAYYYRNPNSSKLLLYFKGNAEDLVLAESQMFAIANSINVSVIGIEYPGYGLYKDNGKATEEKIKEDAEYIYKFCLYDMGIEEKNIIVFGRSIGSGPACFLAGNFNPLALCLMSPFTSIKAVATHKVGIFQCLVAERFKNIEEIGKAKCATFIVHGQLDKMIPFHHAEELYDEATGRPKTFIGRPYMDHDRFNIHLDLLQPLQLFLTQASIKTYAENNMEVPTFNTTNLHIVPCTYMHY